MEKKKVAVIALVVVFIVVISVIVITRNLDKNASTEVALVYEDVATEETEIDLEVSAEVEEEVIEESEVLEVESTEEAPVVIEESEAIEEEPIVEEAKSIYEDVSYIRYATTSLNVRQGLGADTEKIGSLTQNQEVTVIGEVSNSDWVLISYGNGNEGHVNKSYLSESKTVVASTPKTNNNQGTSSQGSTTDNSSQTTQPTDNSGSSSGSSSNRNSDFSAILDAIGAGGGGDTEVKGQESPDGMYIGDFVP